MLPTWEQAICREVRDLTHAADPEIAETLKRTNRPYFVLEGNICALLAAKEHVNIFIYDPIAGSRRNHQSGAAQSNCSGYPGAPAAGAS